VTKEREVLKSERSKEREIFSNLFFSLKFFLKLLDDIFGTFLWSEMPL